MKVKVGISLSNKILKEYAFGRIKFFGLLLDLDFENKITSNFDQLIKLIYKNEIDAAIVDSKDALDLNLSGLDWFWINIYAERDTDTFIFRNEAKHYPKKIGVITTSQFLYCQKKWPEANLEPINNFDIEKLLLNYDLVVVPTIFSVNNVIHNYYYEIANINDMQKPIWDGNTCVIFKKNSNKMQHLRQFFCKSVYFIGAGIGDAKYVTQEALETIQNLDVCLFDNLMDHTLLDYLPENAILVDVGKRCSHHKVQQNKITQLISMYARMGMRVGRLKGGDPSIFGRLAEEIFALEELGINYHILPGISTLNALGAKSGVILTRRGVNRGFCVLSAIKHKGCVAQFNKKDLESMPLIFFMGTKVVDKITQSLIDEGYEINTPAVILFNVGSEEEFEIRGNIGDIVNKMNILQRTAFFNNPPGVLVIGDIAKFRFSNSFLLYGKKVLLVAPDNGLYFSFKDFGAQVLLYKSNISYVIEESTLYFLLSFNAVAISEVKIAQAIINSMRKNKIDIRRLPDIIVDSKSVVDFFANYGIQSSFNLHVDYGNQLAYIFGVYFNNDFFNTLSMIGDVKKINIKALYKNNIDLPKFDIVYFYNMEHYTDFIENNGINTLKNKVILLGEEKILNDTLREISHNIYQLQPQNFPEHIAKVIKNL